MGWLNAFCLFNPQCVSYLVCVLLILRLVLHSIAFSWYFPFQMINWHLTSFGLTGLNLCGDLFLFDLFIIVTMSLLS